MVPKKENKQEQEKEYELYLYPLAWLREFDKPLYKRCICFIKNKATDVFLIEAWFVKTKQLLKESIKEVRGQRELKLLSDTIEEITFYRKFLYTYYFVLTESIENNQLWRRSGFPALMHRFMSLFSKWHKEVQKILDKNFEKGLYSVDFKEVQKMSRQGIQLRDFFRRQEKMALNAYRAS